MKRLTSSPGRWIQSRISGRTRQRSPRWAPQSKPSNSPPPSSPATSLPLHSSRRGSGTGSRGDMCIVCDTGRPEIQLNMNVTNYTAQLFIILLGKYCKVRHNKLLKQFPKKYCRPLSNPESAAIFPAIVLLCSSGFADTDGFRA